MDHYNYLWLNSPRHPQQLLKHILLKKIFSLSRDERLEIINKEKSYLYENYSEDVYNKRLNAIIEEVKSENL